MTMLPPVYDQFEILILAGNLNCCLDYNSDFNESNEQNINIYYLHLLFAVIDTFQC